MIWTRFAWAKTIQAVEFMEASTCTVTSGFISSSTCLQTQKFYVNTVFRIFQNESPLLSWEIFQGPVVQRKYNTFKRINRCLMDVLTKRTALSTESIFIQSRALTSLWTIRARWINYLLKYNQFFPQHCKGYGCMGSDILQRQQFNFYRQHPVNNLRLAASNRFSSPPSKN